MSNRAAKKHNLSIQNRNLAAQNPELEPHLLQIDFVKTSIVQEKTLSVKLKMQTVARKMPVGSLQLQSVTPRIANCHSRNGISPTKSAL